MIPFAFWYISLTLLHWLTFPLAYKLFPALADRGYGLSRALGLLLWGYLFWLLASLGIAQNDVGGMLLALAIVAVASAWVLYSERESITQFLRSHFEMAFTIEVLFILAFGFMAFVRSANSELASTEKPMELAFISGIMRSPSFPPQDPWLSGYAISYYYFGYVMTAMLARITGVPATMAHNLMTSLIFGLAAIGSYGILYTLLTRARPASDLDPPSPILRPLSFVFSSLLAPLFLLLMSNFDALLEVLHRHGFFWTQNAKTGQLSSAFWTWLDIKDLNMPPVQPFQFMPDRYWWWWRASRVVQDYDMRHNPLEVIDEFPFFSFLLGDLHPHVLAIPFTLLAIAVALNIFLGGWRAELNLFGAKLRITVLGFFCCALVLGGLAFLNTWDVLIAAALILLAYVFVQARDDRWSWDRLWDLFTLALPLAFASLLLYVPFYLGFSSQAGGPLPSLMYPSRGAQLWVMWGTLLIPIYCWLLYQSITQRTRAKWKLGLALGLGIALGLWILSWGIGLYGYWFQKDFVMGWLASQQMDIHTFFVQTSLRRLSYIGGLITMLAVLIPALALLFGNDEKQSTENLQPLSTDHEPPTTLQFVLLLTALGAILIITPDFVYLRDQFGYRINTVFKFYYQAWILWSLVAAFGITYVLQSLAGWRDYLVRGVIGLVIFCGLLYPLLSLKTKTDDFKPFGGFTLDDLDRVQRENHDEAAAIKWLRAAPNGVIVEAVGDSYSQYARVSAQTGLQAVLGWPGHEAQWRGDFAPQGTRRDDVTTLYVTARWEEAQAIIAKYNIRYIYIGPLERSSMPVDEQKFTLHLSPVFQQGAVVIYEVP